MKMLLDSKMLGTYVKKIPQQMGNKIGSSGIVIVGYTSHWVFSDHTLHFLKQTHMKGVLNLLHQKVLFESTAL